jgi:ketosteroid isomerase-like protein
MKVISLVVAISAVCVISSVAIHAAEPAPSAENTLSCTNAQPTEIQKQKNIMSTRELLDAYYKGFAQKSGWESVIADDFKFVAGDMTKPTPIVGKDAYIQIIKRFSQLFTAMRIKEMMIAEDGAYVLANYDYVFPGGKAINGDVVELWKVKDGKLDTLSIFFDTLTFERLTKPAPKV